MKLVLHNIKAILINQLSKKFNLIKLIVTMKEKARDNLNVLIKKILDVYSDSYYGVRLLKSSSIKQGYVTLIIFLYGILLCIPKSYPNAFLYIDFTQQIIAILTVFLTVLLSAGFIFLSDDTKGWSLARLTIIKHVVRLRGLVMASVIICAISIAPNYQYGDYSLKLLLSPFLIASFIYIIGIFLRVYLWLSDLAADPGLFEDKDNLGTRPFISSSYRFARIVYLIHETNQRDAWQTILERNIPEGYEELIHEEFFHSSEKIIKDCKPDMITDLSLRLEIYEKYYARRNLDSWKLYFDYTKRFLLLYADLCNITRVRPIDKKLAMVWRGKSALERILRSLFHESLDQEYAWNIFEAMDAYIVSSNLNSLPTKNAPQDTVVLGDFIDELLETYYRDKNSLYETTSYLRDKIYWQISYDNLYTNKYNVSFVVLKHFEEWLFSKLDKETEKEKLINIDEAIQALFPDADPIGIGSLYWFMYIAKDINDSQSIIDMIYETVRPFGLIGRTYTYNVTKNEEEHMKEFEEYRNSQRNEGIKLFANMHAGYFTSGFWNIDKLIETGETKIIKKSNDDKGAIRVRYLVDDLRSIKKYYDELKITKADKKS